MLVFQLQRLTQSVARWLRDNLVAFNAGREPGDYVFIYGLNVMHIYVCSICLSCVSVRALRRLYIIVE